VALTKVVKDFT